MADGARRRQRKGVVTRHLGTLERLVAEEDIDGVRSRLDRVKHSFDEFEDTHNNYRDSLENEEEIEASDAWFQDMQTTYVAGVKAAKAWLRTQVPCVDLPDMTNPPVATREDLLNLLHLPKVELDKFDGNPLEYLTFIAVFDEVVGSSVMDGQIKLTRLLQYTCGSAKAAIRNCALIGGESGYNQARDILHNRYGNAHLVSQKIITELKTGKRVMKPQDLQQLADELSMAVTALEQLGKLTEINTQQSMIDILQRCQSYTRNRWRNKALESKRVNDIYPDFKEFAAFVQREAVEACDPVYGFFPAKNREDVRGANFHTIAVTPDHDRVTSSGSQCRTTRAANPSGRTRERCVVCGQPHKLFQCELYKGMQPVDRFEIAKRNKLCYNCLLAGHVSNKCYKQSMCTVPNCSRKHSELLHTDTANVVVHDDVMQVNDSIQVCNIATEGEGASVYLPIVPVIVNGSSRPVYALLDTGSTNTFITKQLAQQLHLQGNGVRYNMSTLSQSHEVKSTTVSFCLTSIHDDVKFNVVTALAVDSIPVRYPGSVIDVDQYPYLADLDLSRLSSDIRVDVLVGMDNADALMPLEVRCSDKQIRQPYATRTLFGWALNGPVGDVTNSLQVSSHFVDLEQRISKLWEIEQCDENIQSLSYDDRKVQDMWRREVKHEGGHYVVPIPWKDGRPSMPNNRALARGRLDNLVKRLHKVDQFDKYSDQIMKLELDGYAEKVPVEEIPLRDDSVWYLPHHAVVSASKPGKLRVVFDCAAKQGDVSLNNQCFQGPDMNNKLVHVLLRFRQYRYAITADIEAMYLQVRIPEKDRNTLRFLWQIGGSVVEYRMTSHLFGGVWCASSSTFALRKIVDDVFTSELVGNTIRRSFYVDDMLSSVRSRDEAVEVIEGTRQALMYGGFHLTKYVMNDAQLLQTVDVENRAKEVKEIAPQMSSKALGNKWDVTDDVFFFTSEDCKSPDVVTRRSMLSRVSSMYDPLGLISPVIIQGKMLFQQSTRLNVTWDESLPRGLAIRWSMWLISLEHISSLRFPRCVIPEEFVDGSIELHHFCDASEVGYGACTYVRAINRLGQIHVSLLISKNRLAPVKPVTIPRLELLSAVVASKLDCVVRRELDVELMKSTFWTDSMIVLAYIQSDSRRFKTFVANRVSLIRENSTPDQWCHIDGNDNPADILSRGCNASTLPTVWFEGPRFLSEYKSSWPIQPSAMPDLTAEDSEMKQWQLPVENTPCVFTGNVEMAAAETRRHPLDVLMQHYSSYYRLKKAVSWLNRFKLYLKGDRFNVGSPITVDEMRGVDMMIIRHVQADVFRDEIASLKQGKTVRRSSRIYNMSPIFKDGLLVVGGRLRHAGIDASLKNPAILPHEHRLAHLICLEYHNAVHLGVEWTLSELRKRYWITNARNLIKVIKKKCVTCRRLYAQGMVQKMADLPRERCEPGRAPFCFVGVDLFGIFYAKVGRSEVKRYGCLYTCFSTRAIHIEVLNNLETDTFINGFVRFVSRRGYPQKVWSDNGTNLVGARSELSKSLRDLDRGKVVRMARRMEIEWVFNPPLASHHGGVWERMIRTVRRILVALLNSNTRLTDEILHTVFCEVECIVNSRPITKCSDDVQDVAALTPNHLLLLRDNQAVPWGVFYDGDTYRKHWRHVQHIATLFWRRWIKEYLPELQRRQKWVKDEPNLNVGDLVLLLDENSPRGSWPLGLVKEISVGRDGLVRRVRVKTTMTELVRPITKLVALEGALFE